VLHVDGLQYASAKAVVERVLRRRPGVISVRANPVAETAGALAPLGQAARNDAMHDRLTEPESRKE
jgi:hypothetical protein